MADEREGQGVVEEPETGPAGAPEDRQEEQDYDQEQEGRGQEGQGQSETDDFKSPESKARLLADLKKARAEAKRAADLEAKVKEYEDRDKTEDERRQERLQAAEARAAAAEDRLVRLEIAQARGLTEAQAKRLVGSTREELEADADELLAAFGLKKQAADGGDDGGAGEGQGGGVRRRPRERLTSGAVPAARPEKSDEDVVQAVLARRRGY